MNYFTLACFAYKMGGRAIIRKLVSSDKTTLDETLIAELDKIAGVKPK